MVIRLDWQELTKISGGAPLVIEEVRLTDSDIAIRGSFELPPLARLSAEDQVFVMVFVRSHGSIKEMERAFGISYPTVKNRLNRISNNMDLVETDPAPPSLKCWPSFSVVISPLKKPSKGSPNDVAPIPVSGADQERQTKVWPVVTFVSSVAAGCPNCAGPDPHGPGSGIAAMALGLGQILATGGPFELRADVFPKGSDDRREESF